MSHWRASQDTRDDVAKSITGGTFFAVLIILGVLIVYTICTTGGNQ